jgi:hypothetical protein
MSKSKKQIDKLPPEAKTAIALAFEGLDGVEGLIKWARSNSHNRATFYADIYPKLLPYIVAGTFTANVENADDSFEALERILYGLIHQRNEEEAAAAAASSIAGANTTIDVKPNPPQPAREPAPRETAPAFNSPPVLTVVSSQAGSGDRSTQAAEPVGPAAEPPSPAAPPQSAAAAKAASVAVSAGPSTTQLFYEWDAAGGSERIHDWSAGPHWPRLP